MPLTKDQFRQNCLQKIKKLHKTNRFYRNAIINQKLQKELKNTKNHKILFYYPLPFEADIRPTLAKMRKKNQIFLPFMEGKSFKMIPFRMPLQKKKFGIFEAGKSLRDIKKVDIVIAPAVGVDQSGRRIGFGKGMYDRFFESLKSKPLTIFIQPCLCWTKKSVCDFYDVGCDLLITPQVKLIRRRKPNVNRNTPRWLNSHNQRGCRFFRF